MSLFTPVFSYFRIWLITALGFCSFSQGEVYNVSTATEFNSLPSLNAGDVVLLADGDYGALVKTLVSTISNDTEALTNPILVIAANAGEVNVSEPSRIILQGRGITFAGLDFVSGSGMRDNGSTSPAYLILTDTNSRYMRISNMRFLDCTSGDDYGHWLQVQGFHHTIEYCHFEGQDEPIRNATVAFKRSTSEAGITTPRNHVLRRCYFGPREASSSENGYETIRIGDSSSQAHDMRVTIEENVFYRSIWRSDGEKPNDMEIISNKTKGNRIIHNTFLESYGQITLRHGDECLVEGNYIFGGGYYSGSSILLNPANPYQSGIRIVGEGHVVRNNYLINLSATGFRAAICLMAGVDSWNDGNGSGGNNGYEPAHSAQIYNNTLIDCREMNLGFVNTGEVQPTNVQIYNNAWQSSVRSNGVVQSGSFSAAGSGGNYFYHPDGDTGWEGLGGTYSSSESPELDTRLDHYFIPTASSPLLDAADSALVPMDDLRGLSRPINGVDIGAFEREATGNGIAPLFLTDVGPEFNGGPMGTYPEAGDTSPMIVSNSLPTGRVSVTYSEALIASAGDGELSWSIIAGAAPSGLTLNSNGVLSGVPSLSGNASFTVRVIDDDGDFDNRNFSLLIEAEPGSEPEKLIITAPVFASSFQNPNLPENSIDDDPESRWSAEGEGEWIQYDLGSVKVVSFVNIAWLNGDERTATFDIELSEDANNWMSAASGVITSGMSEGLETHDIPDTQARYVRIVGYGNSNSDWNSITNLEIWGTLVAAPLRPVTPTVLNAIARNGEVLLSWEASVEATSYQLKRALNTDGPFEVIADTGGTNYRDANVTNGATYYYTVSAVNDSGESADSAQIASKPFTQISSSERFGASVRPLGGNMQITFDSTLGRIYQLQRSDTLKVGSWVNLGTEIIGDGEEIQFTDSDSNEASKRFYRFLIQP